MPGTPTPSQRRKLIRDALALEPAPAALGRDLLLASRLPVLVALAAANRRIGHVNAHWRDYCGLASCEAPNAHSNGGAIAWEPLQAMPNQDHARWMADWAMAAAGGARRHHGHYRLVRACDRLARRHLVQAWRLEDEPQGFAWLVCAVDAEDQLEELDHLRALALRLEAVAVTACHDLRDPLRAASGYLTLLKSRHGAALMPQAVDYIDAAVAGVERMRGMIHSTLERARFGRPLERMRPVDLGAVVAQVLSDLRPAIVAQSALVEVGELPTISAYANEMHSIFLNLIGNALRYRADRPPRVEVAARRIDHAWEFTISDNGLGIASADLERIFGMFERVAVGGDGIGLGLATCRRIIEAHGNRIWARSRLGVGTSFIWSWQDTDPRAGAVRALVVQYPPDAEDGVDPPPGGSEA